MNPSHDDMCGSSLAAVLAASLKSRHQKPITFDLVIAFTIFSRLGIQAFFQGCDAAEPLGRRGKAHTHTRE